MWQLMASRTMEACTISCTTAVVRRRVCPSATRAGQGGCQLGQHQFCECPVAWTLMQYVESNLLRGVTFKGIAFGCRRRPWASMRRCGML